MFIIAAVQFDKQGLEFRGSGQVLDTGHGSLFDCPDNIIIKNDAKSFWILIVRNDFHVRICSREFEHAVIRSELIQKIGLRQRKVVVLVA